MGVDIERINTYDDSRFAPAVLRQHGAFLVDGVPCEVEVTGADSAVVRGEARGFYKELIEDFRFYAEHIRLFYDEAGALLAEYPPVARFTVPLRDVQPSQFFVDRDKLEAVKSFITGARDIVIPVVRQGERYISADGHTRLALAVELGYQAVSAFLTEGGDYLDGFVEEARKRGVCSPYDLKIIPHDEYRVKWDQFCDEYFARQEG